MAAQTYKVSSRANLKASHKQGQVVWDATPFMQELEDSVQRGLDRVGRKVEYTARFNVPVDTGLLYSTIKYFRSKYKSPTGVGSIVYAGNKGKGWLPSRYKRNRRYPDIAYYATWVELGHKIYRKASPSARYSYQGKRKAKLVRGKRIGGFTSTSVPPKRYLKRSLDQWAPQIVGEMQHLGLKVVGGRV